MPSQKLPHQAIDPFAPKSQRSSRGRGHPPREGAHPGAPEARRVRISLSLALAIALLGACDSQGGDARPVDTSPSTASTDDPQVVDLASMGYNEGDSDSAVFGVVEFSDFGCVFCAAFHQESYPALHDEFVATGEVLWKYVPITIGGFPNGRMAGLSGICGARLDAFAAMRDLLYDTREEWMASNQPEPLFVQYAESLGVDGSAFRACLNGEAAAEELDENDRIAVQIGVSGTPTFIVRGIPVRGAPPLASFREALQELIDEVRANDPN